MTLDLSLKITKIFKFISLLLSPSETAHAVA